MPNERSASSTGVEVPVDVQTAEVLRGSRGWQKTVTTHMSVGWAWAFDTPYRWTKDGRASWRHTARHGDRLAESHQGHRRHPRRFHHVIDVVPTILEAAGIPQPEVVAGIAQRPIEGVSMAYTFDQSQAEVPSWCDEQYFEMSGIAPLSRHRGSRRRAAAAPGCSLRASCPTSRRVQVELTNRKDYSDEISRRKCRTSSRRCRDCSQP